MLLEGGGTQSTREASFIYPANILLDMHVQEAGELAMCD